MNMCIYIIKFSWYGFADHPSGVGFCVIFVLHAIGQTENGLVEAVAVLISKMPRMRPELEDGKLGECFKAKPDFMKVSFESLDKWCIILP